eukprot:scaffold310_cov335-Pavlova_lutheri.AAC.8
MSIPRGLVPAQALHSKFCSRKDGIALRLVRVLVGSRTFVVCVGREFPSVHRCVHASTFLAFHLTVESRVARHPTPPSVATAPPPSPPVSFRRVYPTFTTPSSPWFAREEGS